MFSALVAVWAHGMEVQGSERNCAPGIYQEWLCGSRKLDCLMHALKSHIIDIKGWERRWGDISLFMLTWQTTKLGLRGRVRAFQVMKRVKRHSRQREPCEQRTRWVDIWLMFGRWWAAGHVTGCGGQWGWRGLFHLGGIRMWVELGALLRPLPYP